jgi:hypothetical protein
VKYSTDARHFSARLEVGGCANAHVARRNGIQIHRIVLRALFDSPPKAAADINMQRLLTILELRMSCFLLLSSADEKFLLREITVTIVSFIPLTRWHNQVQLGAMGQMRHVGHSVRWIAIESLKIVLMGTDNHQVRANVELMA